MVVGFGWFLVLADQFTVQGKVIFRLHYYKSLVFLMESCFITLIKGGELGVLRVREHPLGAQVHPLIAKCTLSKYEKEITEHNLKPISIKNW